MLKNKPTAGMIDLKDYGPAPAKAANLFKPGEYMLWDYGRQDKVIETHEKGMTRMVVRLRPVDESGLGKDTYERTLNSNRLVAIGTGYFKGE